LTAVSIAIMTSLSWRETAVEDIINAHRFVERIERYFREQGSEDAI
jgi:hypothetical protein